MIEEIDSDAFIRHYFQKALGELDGNPQRFLEAAVAFVRQETDFFKHPGAEAAALGQLLAPKAEPAQPQPPAALAQPAASPAAGSAAQPEQQQPERQPAAPAAPAVPAGPPGPQAESESEVGEAEQQEEEAAEAEGSKGLKPNAGNGADLESYSWTQTLSEVAVAVPVPSGTKGRSCDVSISRSQLRVGLKGQPPVLDGELFAPVKADDCLWNLVDGKLLEITLQKVDGMQWWRSVVKGQPEIDTQAVEPESSKLTDLDPEMRATVEKMMFDQRQKAMGRPTSDELQKQEVIQKFMAAHPEMDFSSAKFA